MACVPDSVNTTCSGDTSKPVLFKRRAIRLRKAGKPVEIVVMEGEDHWLSRGDTRLQMLNSVVAFVERHNPPN